MEKCKICNGEIEELSGFCKCTESVKYIIECYECGCIYEDFDWINNPEDLTIHSIGTCDECWEREIENLK